MRVVANVSFVSCVEQNQRVVLARVVDPARELLPSRDRPGRIVGETKINEIDMFPAAAGRFGNEIIFGGAR